MSTKLASEQDKECIARGIKRIIEIADECVTSPTNPSIDFRKTQSPNPYRRTSNGLYLGFNYGRPSVLWTPWGGWYFMEWYAHVDVQSFLEHLTLEIETPERRAANGNAGPVYRVLAVEDMQMPEPTLADYGHLSSEAIETIQSGWQELFEDWTKPH